MSPANLITECRKSGVEVMLSGDSLKLKGTNTAVREAVNRIKPFKAEVVLYLSTQAASLVQEFMEVDGMSHEAAADLAAQCPAPRPPAEWIAMIAELDALLGEASRRFGLDMEARERIFAARKGQALSTIPESLHLVRTYLAAHFPTSNEGEK